MADSFVEVGRRSQPQGARPCGAGPSPPCSSRTPPGPGCPSRRRPSACRPTCCPSPPARRRSRRASRCGTPSRPSRPSASMPWSSATPPRGCPPGWPAGCDHCVVINAGDGWHEHPTQALLDLYTVRQALGGGDAGLGRIGRAAGGDRGRHPPQPGGPIAGHRLCRRGRRGHPGGAAHALPPSLEGWPVADVSPRPRRRAAEGRRGLAAPCAVRAGERGLRPQSPRVHRRVRPHLPAGGRCSTPTPSSSIPGPSSVAWRSPRTWPSCPPP